MMRFLSGRLRLIVATAVLVLGVKVGAAALAPAPDGPDIPDGSARLAIPADD